MRPFKRFECVEVVFPIGFSANRQLFNTDIPQLRSDKEKDIVIRSIEVYPAEVVPLSFNQNIMLTQAQLAQCFLTLYVEGEESIFRIPFPKLINMYQKGNATPVAWTDEVNQTDNLQVDWTKSYISVIGAAFANVTVIAVLLGITYERLAAGTMNILRAKKALALSQGGMLP
jgi:hypothetical protein